MTERMKRGWKLLNQSFSVMLSNKSLFIFSLVAGIVCLILLSLILIPIHRYEHLLVPFTQAKLKHLLWLYLALAIFLFLSHFIIFIFSAALIHSTLCYFKGKPINIADGFKNAFSVAWKIYLWLSYASTIGLFIFLFQNNLKKFKWMSDLLIESSWNIATFLILPVIVAEKKSALKAFRRSADLIYENWGLSVRPNFGYGIYILLARLIALIPLLLGIIYGESSAGITMGFVITVILYLIITGFNMSTNVVLSSAIYFYATEKKIPPQYDDEIKHAFVFYQKNAP